MSKINENPATTNASYVADNVLQTKNIKIQVLFKILLVAVKTPVRRTIGIIAPATRCKTEQFRSRIGLSKSSPRWGKRGGQIAISQKALDQ